MIKLPLAVLVAVVTLLGGFYGGYKTGQSGGSANTALAQTTGSGGNRFGAGNFALGACPSPGATPNPSASGRLARRGTSGTITILTSTSLTVHDTRCTSDTKVTFDPSVIIRKTVDGQASDLQENQTVAVQGTRQPDGSIKANTITIVPAGSAFGIGGGGGAAAGG